MRRHPSPSWRSKTLAQGIRSYVVQRYLYPSWLLSRDVRDILSSSSLSLSAIRSLITRIVSRTGALRSRLLETAQLFPVFLFFNNRRRRHSASCVQKTFALRRKWCANRSFHQTSGGVEWVADDDDDAQWWQLLIATASTPGNVSEYCDWNYLFFFLLPSFSFYHRLIGDETLLSQLCLHTKSERKREERRGV